MTDGDCQNGESHVHPPKAAQQGPGRPCAKGDQALRRRRRAHQRARGGHVRPFDEELRDKTGSSASGSASRGPTSATASPSRPASARRPRRERCSAPRRRSERRSALSPSTSCSPRLSRSCARPAKRTLGMRHFDVQLMGGIVLHQGKIAEMKTGEGKTLVATLPLYLNALAGTGAHLVTVNDYLAQRDAGWMGPIYHLLGLSRRHHRRQDLSFVYDPEFLDETHPDPRLQHLRPCTRREATTPTSPTRPTTSSGFDYLRDNMAHDARRMVQRELHYAIVDEVDSILIDEARTPLIISGQAERGHRGTTSSRSSIPRLVDDEDFTVDEKRKPRRSPRRASRRSRSWTGITQPLRPRARRLSAPDQPGAQGARALPHATTVHRQGRRGDHRRRVHRPPDARPPVVRRPPPGDRGQGGRRRSSRRTRRSRRSRSRTTSACTTSSPA